MPLVPGDRLGPYEITAPIGAGGMGEVYRARDPKLNRDVAIKVLPDVFARDPERLTRFTREAQTLAALNHPNVAQVFGVHEDALVMECVDGEDLAQRISRGALPIDDVIALGLQIACGLEAAHERGIVHRDLKPANVRVTPDGTAKILDFGVAKAMSAEGTGASSDVMNSPTFTSPPTAMGMIVGTAGYMAPEQARGKPVDKRADIWAFGCVLYEMLTARRPFGGETVTDALAAIVKDEPDWTALPADTPRALQRLVAHCLVKDPRQRIRDIGDARIALERITAGAAEEAPRAAVALPQPGGRFGLVHLLAVAAGVALLTGLATWNVTRPARAAASPMASFVTPLTSASLPLRANGAGVAFAPDGSWIIYAAQPAGQSVPSLFRRRIDAFGVEPLPETAGAVAPFASPDGKWIGFFTDKAVMKLSLAGRGVSKICDRGVFSRADWAPDGTIVLGTAQTFGPGPLGRVAADGGTPVPLTTLGSTDRIHQLPHVMPDGRHVLFTILGAEGVQLATVSLDGGPHQPLGIEGSGAVFVQPGHLLFARRETMFAVPFDPHTRTTTGSPMEVLEDAAVYAGGPELRIPILGVNDAGSVAYLNRGTALSGLGWMESSGQVTPLASSVGEYRQMSLSPDGRRLAFAGSQNFVPDIWVMDLARGTRLRLTSSYGLNPVWSPDGARIAYADRETGIFSVASDASAAAELVLARDPSQFVYPTSWSPDGTTVVFTAETPVARRVARNRDVWMVRRGEKAQPLLNGAADEQGGAISPDGRWLAYMSNASGRDEVYVRAFRGPGGTIPVSNDGGSSPAWAPGGDALYFTSGTKVMRATVAGTSSQIGAPALVQSLPPGVTQINVGPEGRFLLAMPREDADRQDLLHVVLNWGPSLGAGR